MSKVLVILETAERQAPPHCLPGITCAPADRREGTGGELHLLVLGADPSGPRPAAIAQAGYGAAACTPSPPPSARAVHRRGVGRRDRARRQVTGATHVGGTASSTLRDALPRAAALLDAPLVSEIVRVKSGRHLHAPGLGRAARCSTSR
jgi:electron transfer flavoprotein alpha subunit